MALHHPRAVLLALSVLLGILGSHYASDTSLILVDQLTVEQAYLEGYRIQRQLARPNSPYSTVKQGNIVDRIATAYLYRFYKPNDLLRSSILQLMIDFRQAFTNWPHPVESEITRVLDRGDALWALYYLMVDAVKSALVKKGRGGGVHKKAVTRANAAVAGLLSVTRKVDAKWIDESWKLPDDLNLIEAAIEKARNAVMALPRLDENGELVITGDGGQVPGGSSSKPRNKLFYLLTGAFVGGPMLVLAAAAGYHLLRGHLVLSSGDLYSLSTSNITHNVTSPAVAFFASEGLSHLWSILLLGSLVALIAWCWWYCIKTGGEDEASSVSKQTSKKSQELSSTTSTSSST